MLLLGLAAATAVIVHASESAAGQERAADPKKLVLRLADMPTGFVRKGGRYVSNARAEQDNDCGGPPDTRATGRVNGYEATFEHGGGFATVTVGTGAEVYRTVAGTRRSFVAVDRALVRCRRKYGFRRASLRTRIGHEARLWAGRQTQQGFTLEFATVMWRSGTTFASVSAAGLGTVDLAFVVRLAKRQQIRIERAS